MSFESCFISCPGTSAKASSCQGRRESEREPLPNEDSRKSNQTGTTVDWSCQFSFLELCLAPSFHGERVTAQVSPEV